MCSGCYLSMWWIGDYGSFFVELNKLLREFYTYNWVLSGVVLRGGKIRYFLMRLSRSIGFYRPSYYRFFSIDWSKGTGSIYKGILFANLLGENILPGFYIISSNPNF